MHEGFQFDSEKFREAVHTVIGHAQPDTLGNIKLHKILYYSDMLMYLNIGSPLTGEDYLRQRFGPTSRHLTREVRRLVKEKKIKAEKVDFFGYVKVQYEALTDLCPNRLSNSEVALLRSVTDFVCAQTASDISEFSHDLVWKSVPMGQVIPYCASLVWQPVEVTPEDMDDAVAEAGKIAPLVEADRRAGRLL